MPAIPAIALAVAVVGTGYSIYSGERAAGEQKKANQLQQQQADLSAARQQRDAVRQSRVAFANAQAASERQGAGTSSSAQGGQGSIASQMTDTLSFLDKYNYFSDQASQHLGKAMQYRQDAETGSAVAGLGMAAYQNGPAIQKTVSGH